MNAAAQFRHLRRGLNGNDRFPRDAAGPQSEEETMKQIAAISLTAALLSLIGCGSSSPSATAPAPKMVTVEVLEFSYNPKSIQINAGDTVRWVFAGTDPTHTVTALRGAFDSGFIFLQPGDFYDQTFNQDNVTLEYSCASHKACCAMQGSIRVGRGAPPPMTGY
jgi:plastocyanin